MTRRPIERLPGMRDVTAEQRDRMSGLASATEAYFEEQGYQPIHTPLLEQTELFVRKSGGDLVNRLYTFQDPGGNEVSLRPEFTSSVIRHYVEVADTLHVPARWQYRGPVFRYETDGGEGALREFTQLGAELVGARGVDADAEIMHLAWSGLARAGLAGCTVRVGHLGAVNALLAEHDLSEAAKLFIVGNLRPLKEGETDVEELKLRAQNAGLLRERAEDGIGGEAGTMDLQAAQEVVRRVVADPSASRMGQRTPEQIASRLLRKMRRAHDPGVFEAALEMVDELARVEGAAGPALDSLREAAGGAAARCGAYDELARLVDALAARGVPDDAVSLDVGLARGIAYYTGAIFEMYAGPEGGPSLGGGGRYDGLVRALGGGDVPAMGFAYNMESVLEALTGVGAAAVAR